MLKVKNGHVPVLNLNDYFTDHSLLKIPNWQRDYSWDSSDEGQVGVLLEDLQGFVSSKESAEYLMGSVILCEGTSEAEHLVIDGQQRSLTLSIFLMVALKYIRNHDLVSPHKPAEMALATNLNACVDAGQIGINFKSRLVMNNPKADSIIRKIHAWTLLDDSAGDDILGLPADATKSERNLVEAAQYMYRKLSSEEIFSKVDFIKSMEKIISSVKLVVLTLDDQIEALRVYDRINNRGMVLSSADLIKNIIFMNVTDSEFDAVSDSWLEMAKELNGTGKARLQDPKFLLRMLASIETGTKITYDGLVDYWSERIEDGTVIALDFAGDLPVRASALKKLASSQTMIPAGEVEDWIEPTPVLVTQLHIPYELNSVQHYSVLLAGMHFEKPETLSKLGLQVASRALLYIFAQERTQSFETIIPVWANAVLSLPKDADPADLDSLYIDKAFQVDNPISVLESALQANMRSWSYENASDRKRIRALFALLNLEISKRWAATDLMRTRRLASEKHGWDIDHIMPKSLVPDKWVHRLGNLTLLSPPDNRWAGTIRPIEKIDQNYYHQSEVALTKTCDNLDRLTPLVRGHIEEVFKEAKVKINFVVDTTWGEESVDARTEFLVDWATHVLITRFKAEQ
tara:strand:+ start:3993 stop:5882 length:1890 start_codon:yes stop_codon:yes gene_type:complete